MNALGTGGLAQKAVLPVLGVGEAGGQARAGRGPDLSPEAPGHSPVLACHPLALSTHATVCALDWIGPCRPHSPHPAGYSTCSDPQLYQAWKSGINQANRR